MVQTFRKDKRTGIVLNVGGDISKYYELKKQIKEQKKTKEELSQTKDEMSKLKAELTEIRELLKQVIK